MAFLVGVFNRSREAAAGDATAHAELGGALLCIGSLQDKLKGTAGRGLHSSTFQLNLSRF